MTDWTQCNRHTPMFDFAGQTVTARLVGSHDADTCRVVFETSVGLRQVIVRVEGIDAPEMNSKDPQEKMHATTARNEFLQLAAPDVFAKHGQYTQKDIVNLLNKHLTLVTLHLGPQDKYGRTLSTVISRSGVDVGQRLIDNGTVHRYYGKTKEPWYWLDNQSVGFLQKYCGNTS